MPERTGGREIERRMHTGTREILGPAMFGLEAGLVKKSSLY